jgi:hypothetical protein
MITPIIKPPVSPWEAFVKWCQSWSPQVKQGVIGSVVAVVVFVGGCLFSSRSKNVPQANFIATNISGSAIVQGTGNNVSIDNSAHYGTTNIIPGLPQIIIETFDGLPLGTTNNPQLRMHHLVVRNSNDVEIHNFCSRLQFPEPIVQTTETNVTTGTRINWRPLLDNLLVKGTGGRTEGGLWIGPTSKVSFVDSIMCFFPRYAKGEKMALSMLGDITGVWELEIDTLSAGGGHVSLTFFTSTAREGTNYLNLASVPLWQSPPNPQVVPDTNELRFSLEGEYQYQANFKPGKQHFLVPIMFDSAERNCSSLKIQPEIGSWHPVMLVFQ